MATLKDVLPAPTDGFTLEPKSQEADKTTTTALTVVAATPSAQAGVSKVLTLTKDATGDFDYSAIVRQGENATRTVHTSATALVEKPRDAALNPLPTSAEASAATARTRAALEKVVNGKIAASKTTHPDTLAKKEKPSFVRYTPANTNQSHNSGATQRIIKMVEAPVDPMLPPRFAHRKAPVNPPSPPVPVMHSPERKLSKAEAADWKIPPVVSNWKNNRGYTISLEKRLAADGRATQDHSINDRFAAMAEALYNAERSARDDVEKRAQLQRRVSLRAKEAKERELRELAERARRERKGYLGLSADATDTESIAPSESAARAATEQWLRPSVGAARPVVDEAPPSAVVATPVRSGGDGPPRRPRRSRFADMAPGGAATGTEHDVDDEAVRRRDEIRRERREAREREMRRREAHGDESTAPTLKRSKLSRDQDRDLAERVALGQGVKSGGGSGEVLYDQRLFNQDGASGTRGSLAGGYGADDSYNLYDRPLFSGGNASSKFQYRPPRTGDDEAEGGDSGVRGKFRADKGFAGGAAGPGGTNASRGGGFRDRPVEFERDTELKSSANDDPYGLEKFFSEAKQFEKKG